jgi:hypothetical protein
VDISGQMNRALAVYRIPSRGVSRTEILGLQANVRERLIDGQIFYTGCRFPGCATGSPPANPEVGNSALCQLYLEFGQAEPFSVWTQADLPGQAASCGRGKDAFDRGFFP